MFREMRRKNQELSRKEADQILRQGTSGVLAVLGDGGYPYAVPISYVYADGKLYFHCAKAGHKLDALRREPKASFCVIGQDQVAPEEYTTYYRSVIAFGRVRELEEAEEMRRAIDLLAQKYAPQDSEENRQKAIDREWEPLCMLEMTLEYVTGKESMKLRQKK